MSNNLLALLAKFLGEQGLNWATGGLLILAQVTTYMKDMQGFYSLLGTIPVLIIFGYAMYSQAKTNQYKAETEREKVKNELEVQLKELDQNQDDEE